MSTIRILAWNVYEGHKPADVVRQLRLLARLHKPDVIGLGECLNLNVIAVDGYTTFHLPKDKNRPKGSHDEATDTAVLIRHGIKIRRHNLLQMRKPWVGPKHGWPHPPKTYHAFLLDVDGKTWKVSAGHWPTGLTGPRRVNRIAVQETAKAIRRWFRRTLPGRPTIHFGDLNNNAATVSQLLGVNAHGHRVDVAAYRNARFAGMRVLGPHGSDHDALLWTFRSGK